MKKLMAVVAVIVIGLGYAVGTPPVVDDYHRVYFEPDFSWNLAHTYKGGETDWKSWGQYYGVSAGYEFLKPNFAYVGIEAILSLGNRFAEWEDPELGRMKGEGNAYKNKIEGLVGYPLKVDQVSLLPFTGAGGYFLAEPNYNEDIAYIPIGLKAEYQFKQFNIGLKAEQMHFIRSWEIYRGNKTSYNLWERGSYGYEVSLPISFKADVPGGNWEAAIEPYYLKVFNAMTFLGGRISAIHSF